ncbi:hypothetical protein V2J09_012906 [Rumex salicifolius]
MTALQIIPRSSASSSSTMSKYSPEEIISAVSFVAVFSLLQLPFEKIDGSPVPTIIFKDRASYFHAFVLGLNFAFCGGVITISLRQIYPKIADISRYLSILSMLVAAGVFSALAVPWAAGALFSGSSFSIASA